MNRLLIRLMIAKIVLVGLVYQVRAADPVDFGRQVRPILSQYCSNVMDRMPGHGRQNCDWMLPQGHLPKVIVPGHPDRSELIKRVSTDVEQQMPPPEIKVQLSKQQKEVLRQWVQQGADYQQHWSFVPPSRPSLPTTRTIDWARNSIDAFVLARLEKERLQPQSQADRATLVRRLTFDLTGLPPTLAKIDDFLEDSSPQAYEKVVDRLLGSTRYGEHMAGTGWRLRAMAIPMDTRVTVHAQCIFGGTGWVSVSTEIILSMVRGDASQKKIAWSMFSTARLLPFGQLALFKKSGGDNNQFWSPV